MESKFCRAFISAESIPQVYRVQVWQKTQVSQGKIFSAFCYHNNSPDKEIIKGSIEPTHGSVCSDVRKLQSMDVLKLQSTKANWNTKCHFHILTYIYSNLLDISTSYFIKILSYRERLDVDSQKTKTKNAPFICISGVKE